MECPLCMEPLEIDDVNFFPCTCGYQICRFCWHRIRTDENGLCPACRKVDLGLLRSLISMRTTAMEELLIITNIRPTERDSFMAFVQALVLTFDLAVLDCWTQYKKPVHRFKVTSMHKRTKLNLLLSMKNVKRTDSNHKFAEPTEMSSDFLTKSNTIQEASGYSDMKQKSGRSSY